MQVQSSEPTLFNFLIFWKSRFPRTKFYNINYWSYLGLDISDSYEHRASVRASLAGDPEWIGDYFGKVVSMFQQQDNLTLNLLPGKFPDVVHPDGKGIIRKESSVTRDQ